MNFDIQRVLRHPTFREKFLARNFIEPILGTPEQFGDYIKAGAAKWKKLIVKANIRVE